MNWESFALATSVVPAETSRLPFGGFAVNQQTVLNTVSDIGYIFVINDFIV